MHIKKKHPIPVLSSRKETAVFAFNLLLFVVPIDFGEVILQWQLSSISVKHLSENKQGWQVAETSHFLIFHNQPKDLVEKVSNAAEAARIKATYKWFGINNEAWVPKCTLFLHSNCQNYARATGVTGNSPGHTTIKNDDSHVVTRQIDIRCDLPNMISAVLPHEVTHAVLAGQFCPYQVPRWADEGIAVLSEQNDRVIMHRQHLIKFRQQGALLNLKELMEMQDYPPRQQIKLFYAQSICLTDFLSKEKGPIAFTDFVRDGLKESYDASLKRHYSWNFVDLEKRWQLYLSGK